MTVGQGGLLDLGDAHAVALGEDDFGRNAIHTDIVGPDLRSEVLCHHDDARLSCGVWNGRVCMGPARGSRRYGDKAAAPARLHAREKALDRKERRVKIALHGRSPVLVADVFQHRGPCEAAARIGYENVDRAQLVFDIVPHRLDLWKLPDIRRGTYGIS